MSIRDACCYDHGMAPVRKPQDFVQRAFEDKEWMLLMRDAEFVKRFNEMKNLEDAEFLIQEGVYKLYPKPVAWERPLPPRDGFRESAP